MELCSVAVGLRMQVPGASKNQELARRPIRGKIKLVADIDPHIKMGLLCTLLGEIDLRGSVVEGGS